MSKSYPIWINVSGDNYKTDKSFGSRDSVTMDIKVGSSKTNSHELARVSVHWPGGRYKFTGSFLANKNAK